MSEAVLSSERMTEMTILLNSLLGEHKYAVLDTNLKVYPLMACLVIPAIRAAILRETKISVIHNGRTIRLTRVTVEFKPAVPVETPDLEMTDVETCAACGRTCRKMEIYLGKTYCLRCISDVASSENR